MEEKDLKVQLLASSPRVITVDNRPTFVKIEHIPSKITVTKYNRSQYKAKQEALEELEMLVEIWGRS